MTTLTLAPTLVSGLSATAERLLALFRGEPVRWIVLRHVNPIADAGLSPEEFARAIEELESAELVERAPYGPLLYIR